VSSGRRRPLCSAEDENLEGGHGEEDNGREHQQRQHPGFIAQQAVAKGFARGQAAAGRRDALGGTRRDDVRLRGAGRAPVVGGSVAALRKLLGRRLVVHDHP